MVFSWLFLAPDVGAVKYSMGWISGKAVATSGNDEDRVRIKMMLNRRPAKYNNGSEDLTDKNQVNCSGSEWVTGTRQQRIKKRTDLGSYYPFLSSIRCSVGEISSAMDCQLLQKI
jgi:hypothetical protein